LSRKALLLRWRPQALEDRAAIMDRIALDNPNAAIELDLEFEAKAEIARLRPALYKLGRVKGTRELVVRSTYVMVYRVLADAVEMLRVLHTAQRWPSARPGLAQEPDDVPLSSRQPAASRKAAKPMLRRGKVASKKSPL
jgi:addiction module RelE/StbE family toxin